MLSADGDSLISSGVQVGNAIKAGNLKAPKHIRINAAANRAQARERHQKWDDAMQVSERWAALKASRASGTGGPVMAPSAQTTTGNKVGLCLLVDFSDDVATMAQSEIDNYCNGDSYTGFGNVSSVKKYYQDVSNGTLTYTNVVTIYIRAPQPKSYYNNTSLSDGTQGRLLINDVIAAMKARPDYYTAILPTFASLTTGGGGGSGNVVATNVFFTGNNSGVWAYGLWPNSWALAAPVDLGNGKCVYKYEITNIGASLEIGTFCHENGHMLCNFPDLYDYGFESNGVGMWCLMSAGSHGGSGNDGTCPYRCAPTSGTRRAGHRWSPH